MKFTPAQTQALVGVSTETLRYWKKHLGPIAERRGHAPCYSRAEVLALLVVRHLVRNFSIDISALGKHADQLFAACAMQWIAIGNRWLIVKTDGEVIVRDTTAQLELTEPVIVIPLAAVVRELNEHLTDQDTNPQMPLALPPIALTRPAGGSR